MWSEFAHISHNSRDNTIGMFFITNRKVLFGLIGALSLACLIALGFWGLNFGIEFTGGTLVEVRYDDRPEKVLLEERVSGAVDGLGVFSLRASGEQGYMLRTRDVTEEEYQEIQNALAVEGSGFEEERRATVGPSIGTELKNKALAAIAVVSVLIILYVAFAFRNVQDDEEDDGERTGVSSWTYGFIAIFVLLHDLLVPLGVFAVLGQFAGAEVDVLIVMALLTILGYSVNDTIVIFDRVRENLLKNKEERTEESFAETVGKSLGQTYARSINTSLTTLLVVVSLLVFGGSTTTYFALVLATGVLAGTYSSLALAAPLLVTIEEYQRKKREAGK